MPVSLARYSTTTAMAVKMVGTVFDAATIALVAVCLDDASEEIRKKLSKRYDFTTGAFDTTTTCPVIIKTICETLALGYAYENMARGSKEGLARADRYLKRGMDNLTLVASGDAALIGPNGVAVTQITTDWQAISNTSGYANTFNEDNPRDWKPDTNKIDDIKSERED